MLTNQRLQSVACPERERVRRAVDKAEADKAWRDLVLSERAARNRKGGYWIAEALPDAAHHAECARWKRTEIDAALAATDGVGVGVGVDTYGQPDTWDRAITISRTAGPAGLIQLVTEVETADPKRRRWPRRKRHDDKSACLVEFDTTE